MNIEITLAGVPLRISLRLEETARYFENEPTFREAEGWDIRVEDEDLKRYPLICPTGVLDPFSEAYLLMARASVFLLQYRRVLIHGVSFVWHGCALLFTAPSGTGKTTQLRHWQRLFGKQINLINGDKSVLALRDDGSFWLHPSPWMGKERDVGFASAPLGGIVLLEQADHNSIRRIAPRESVLRIFQQFLVDGEDPKTAHALGALEDRLLYITPVWLLENLGDEASARLTYQTLLEYEEQLHESL